MFRGNQSELDERLIRLGFLAIEEPILIVPQTMAPILRAGQKDGPIQRTYPGVTCHPPVPELQSSCNPMDCNPIPVTTTRSVFRVIFDPPIITTISIRNNSNFCTYKIKTKNSNMNYYKHLFNVCLIVYFHASWPKFTFVRIFIESPPHFFRCSTFKVCTQDFDMDVNIIKQG